MRDLVDIVICEYNESGRKKLFVVVIVGGIEVKEVIDRFNEEGILVYLELERVIKVFVVFYCWSRWKKK